MNQNLELYFFKRVLPFDANTERCSKKRKKENVSCKYLLLCGIVRVMLHLALCAHDSRLRTKACNATVQYAGAYVIEYCQRKQF